MYIENATPQKNSKTEKDSDEANYIFPYCHRYSISLLLNGIRLLVLFFMRLVKVLCLPMADGDWWQVCQQEQGASIKAAYCHSNKDGLGFAEAVTRVGEHWYA